MNRNAIRFSASLALAILVAGCGGGGGGGGGFFPPIAGTPAPAQSDPLDKFIAYVKDLVASAVDMAEPADVSAFDPPPTSETREAIATQ